MAIKLNLKIRVSEIRDNLDRSNLFLCLIIEFIAMVKRGTFCFIEIDEIETHFFKEQLEIF